MLAFALMVLAVASAVAPVLARHSSGSCPGCRQPIRKDELIVFDVASQQWYHDECAPADEGEE